MHLVKCLRKVVLQKKMLLWRVLFSPRKSLGTKKVASVILATDQQPCSSETIIFEPTISKDSQNEDKIKVRVLNPTKIRALIHKREQLRVQIRELEDRELDFDDPEKEDRLIGHEIEMKKAIIEVEETLKRAGVLLYKQKEEGEEHEDFKIVLTGTGFQALDDRLNAFLAKRDLQNASEVWLSSEQIHQLMVEQYEADHSSDRTVRVPAPNTDDFTRLFLHVCDRVLPKLRTIRISMLQSYLEEDHLKSKGIAVEPPVLPSHAPLTKLSDATLTYEETLKHICSNDSQEAEPESADECDKGDEEYMEEGDGVRDAEGTKTAENESCSENSQDDLHDNGHQLDSSKDPLCLNMYEKNQYEVTKDVMQKMESQMETKDEPKSAPYFDEKEDSEEDCDVVFVCEQYAEVNEQSETIEKEQVDEATHDGDMCKVVYETTDDNESATDVPKYVEVEAMEEEEDKEADSSVTPPINPLSVAPKSELTSIRDHSVREMEEDKSTLPASPSPPIFSGPSKIEYHEVNKFDEPIELYQPKQVVPAYEADDDDILFIEVVKGHGPAYETDVGIVNTAKNDYVWKWLTEKFFLPEEIAVVDIADSDDEAILSQGEARTEKFRLSMNSEEKQPQKRPEEDNSVNIVPKKARFCGGNDGQLL